METNMNNSRGGDASMIPPATGSSKINIGNAERIISVIGGTALSYFAVKNIHKSSGKIFGLISMMLLKRGVTGHCEVNKALNRDTANQRAKAVEATAVLEINKPRRDLYAFWRKLENLPSFMKHLANVEELDERRSKWTAKIPGGIGTVSWEAVLLEEGDNEYLSWSSLPGSTLDNAGEVVFEDDLQGSGTTIRVKISYRLPGGDVGGLEAQLINPLVEKMIQSDLNEFKQRVESGELTVPEVAVASDAPAPANEVRSSISPS